LRLAAPHPAALPYYREKREERRKKKEERRKKREERREKKEENRREEDLCVASCTVWGKSVSLAAQFFGGSVSLATQFATIWFTTRP
jgi:single-stranded DNA-binding protein